MLSSLSPPVQNARHADSRHTSRSCLVRPMNVGLPVVPLVEYILLTCDLAHALCRPNGGSFSWLSRSSDFSVKGSLLKSSSVLISESATPAFLNFSW